MPVSKEIKRSVYFISDGTAITAETLGHSLLAQFPNVDFDIHIMPYITTEEAAMNVVAEINACQNRDGSLPLVFDTLVDPHVREIINTAKAVNLDVFEGLISKLSDELGTPPTTLVGQTHAVTDSEYYKARIDAVHFALDNDDGARTRHYDKADIILIGVSRSGKHRLQFTFLCNLVFVLRIILSQKKIWMTIVCLKFSKNIRINCLA